jgi:hypothetical protein
MLMSGSISEESEVEAQSKSRHEEARVTARTCLFSKRANLVQASSLAGPHLCSFSGNRYTLLA